MIRNLIKRSSVQFFGTLLGKAISIIVFIFVARDTNPEIFGKIIFFITVVQIATIFADFGLNQYYQKQSNFLNKRKLINRVLNARLASLFLSIILVFLILITSQTLNLLISLLTVLLLLPEAALSIFDGFYLVKKQPSRIALKYISKISLLAITYLIFRKFIQADQLMSFVVVAWCLNSFITAMWFIPWKIIKNWQISFKNSFNTLKKSSKYAVLTLTSFAYARGDQMVIEYRAGSAALGLYNISYRYLETLSLLPASLSQNLFHISGREKGISLKQLLKILFLMAFLGVLAGIGLFYGSDFLTSGILGEAYSGGSYLLKIFSLVLFLFFINSPLATVVQSSKLINKFLPWGVANTLLNIALNIILIPIYGFEVAAWVMLLTETTGLLINLGFVLKIYKNK
jgi:O-antigen/teichoic acid export membrane protein